MKPEPAASGGDAPSSIDVSSYTAQTARRALEAMGGIIMFEKARE